MSNQKPKVKTLQCDLTDSPINLTLLREHTKRELLKLFTNEVHKRPDESVVLVLEPDLIGPLGLMVSHHDFLIEELGIQRVYQLEATMLDSQIDHVVYITRPTVKNTAIICDQILRNKNSGGRQRYYVFYVPKVTLVCERIFNEYDVYDSIVVKEFNFDFVPLDTDIISLEINSAYKDYNLHSDYTTLYYIAKSMLKFQNLYGFIPEILGKGHAARALVELMIKIRKENATHESHILPEVHKMVIIDRSSDPITPLCTQLTYEGLMDEIFEIHNSCVDLPSELLIDPKTKKEMDPGRFIETPMNSTDNILKDIRDQNISVIGPLLNEKARVIDEYYKIRHSAADDNNVFKSFVAGLGDVQKDHFDLQMHISIAGEIVQITRSDEFRKRLEMEQTLLCEAGKDEILVYIMECIDKQKPLVGVLRLVCLASLTLDGIDAKYFEYIRTGIVQSYGFAHILTIENLIEMGLFKKSATIKFSDYSRINRDFKLIVEDLNEQNPNDISYVFSGYAPLSVRLIEESLHCNPPFDNGTDSVTYEGWGGRYDDSKVSGGPFFRTRQHLKKELQEEESSSPKVYLIFYLGGITHAEISAIRWLNSRHEHEDKQFILMTTSIINGNKFIKGLQDTL